MWSAPETWIWGPVYQEISIKLRQKFWRIPTFKGRLPERDPLRGAEAQAVREKAEASGEGGRESEAKDQGIFKARMVARCEATQGCGAPW